MTKASQAINTHRIFFILTWRFTPNFQDARRQHSPTLANILPSHLVNGLQLSRWAGIYPSWKFFFNGFDRPYHGETTWQRVEQVMTIVEHLVNFEKLIAVVLCYIIVFSYFSFCIW